MLERLIRDSKTWALVDPLSGDVVGKMNLAPSLRGCSDRCGRDDDFWVRGSSLRASREADAYV
jgi:hypothetical protein